MSNVKFKMSNKMLNFKFKISDFLSKLASNFEYKTRPSIRHFELETRQFLTLILLIISTLSYAQSVKRIELPTRGDGQNYQVITLGNDGVLLISRTGKQAFSVTKYDENLEEAWTREGALEGNENFINYAKEGSNIFLLFSKSNNDIYQIIQVTTSIGLLKILLLKVCETLKFLNLRLINLMLIWREW